MYKPLTVAISCLYGQLNKIRNTSGSSGQGQCVPTKLFNVAGGCAAVDDQQRTGDIARRVGCEEDAWVRDLLDTAETPERARPRDHRLDCRIRPHARRRAFRVDRPRRDTVDADTVFAELAGMRGREVDDARLRRAVGEHGG